MGNAVQNDIGTLTLRHRLDLVDDVTMQLFALGPGLGHNLVAHVQVRDALDVAEEGGESGEDDGEAQSAASPSTEGRESDLRHFAVRVQDHQRAAGVSLRKHHAQCHTPGKEFSIQCITSHISAICLSFYTTKKKEKQFLSQSV